MEKGQIFAYSWFVDEKQTDITVIRIYGLNEKNENTCLIVSNFTPYVYLQLPDSISWDISKAQLLSSKLNNILGIRKPISMQLMYKKRLYYANIHKNQAGDYEKRVYPYLFCNFSTVEDIKQLSFKIRKPINIQGIGNIHLKLHENNANPILQLTSQRNLPTAGWIVFSGKKILDADKYTYCENEYRVSWKNLEYKDSNEVARPLLMGYDIEVNSSDPSVMPQSSKTEDKIFQISCVFSRQGGNKENYENYLLTLGEPDSKTVGDDVNIYMYSCEYELLIGFTELIQERQPNIIIGYNIFTFDIPYMIERAKKDRYLNEFSKQGMDRYGIAKERTIEWSSSAYKNQSFQFLDAEGRIFVDLLPLVRRDYKMPNYQLKTIASHFLKDITKDPLDAKGIFKCYRMGMVGDEKGKKALGVVGKYCVKDSVLVVRLFETLTTWVALCEMSKVCNVPIFSLYTQGQQLKVFSQVYKKCTNENIVVERDGYITQENDYYTGATVFPPLPGVYDKVVPFDFSSLYPTTIIAYNICWSTLVNDDDIPDSECHVMSWDDHIGCEHDPKEIRKKQLGEIIKKGEEEIKTIRKERDLKSNKTKKDYYINIIEEKKEILRPYREERSEIQKSKPKHIICATRKYRWLKKPMGVLPEILTHLLDTRSSTKKEMKGVKGKLNEMKENTDEYTKTTTYVDVLDQRQLALKISSNSCYGALGVRKGYLPLMPGAMCIVGNALISSNYGYTQELEKFGEIRKVWAVNEINRQLPSKCEGVVYKGEKEVIKITFSDGRTLTCTPDHMIKTTDGWVRADKLFSHKVLVGIELPKDEVSIDEDGWGICGYSFNNREQILAFVRVLGFILADGSISKNKTNRYEASVCFGSIMDSTIFCNDIELLTKKLPKITKDERHGTKGNCLFKISIPQILVSKIITIEGIPIGRRVTQTPSLPKFILDPNCPKSIIREFLGGLFGGDGTCPSLSTSHPSFLPISFGWTTIEKYKEEMSEVMNSLISLLSKFDLNFKCQKPSLSRIHPLMIPHDYQHNPRWYFNITSPTNMILPFAQKIGFRYSCYKTNRLTVAASYQRFSDIVRQQFITIVTETSNIYDLGNIEMKDSLEKAQKNKVVLHKESIPTIKDIYNYRANWKKLQGHILLKKYFPTASEYTEVTGTKMWFENYSTGKYDTSCPCMTLEVCDIQSAGIQPVYDIINVPQSSFFANGICVHNCTTYMGRKSIEKAAESIQKDHGGVLIYGDSVSADTPVLIKYPNETINIQTIDTLGSEWIDYEQFKSNDIGRISKEQSFFNGEIWTNGKWSKINRVIRHKINKKMFRILTHTGCVDVTEDHSMLRENGEKAKPGELKVGDTLLHSFPREFIEFDTKIVEGVMEGRKCSKCKETKPLYEFYTKYPICKKCCYINNHRNNISVKPYFSEFEYINKPIELSKEEAFVWGFFMADGSGGKYKSGKYSWAINNQNLNYLNKAKIYLEKIETNFTFKILDTIESSGVYKLVAVGKIKLIAEKYHQIMYDKNKNKIVPYAILNASKEIKEWFFEGYYTGDGYKPDIGFIIPKNGSVRMDCKGKIGCQGLYMLLKSIGYENVTVNTRESKPDIFRINGSIGKPRKNTIAIKKIIPLEDSNYTNYVYDIETEEGIFHAGIGELVVKNTDSNYISFPHLETSEQCWDYSIKVANEVSKLYPKPMSLAFEEKIYWRFFILTKKRYMSLACERDGKVSKDISKKGVLLQRRDNCNFVRKVYGDVVMMIFNRIPKDEILYYIITEINKLCSRSYSTSDFVVTKSVGDIGDLIPKDAVNAKGNACYKVGDYTVKKLPTDEKERLRQYKLKDCETNVCQCDELLEICMTCKEYYLKSLPAQVQLAQKMRNRGQLVSAGSRLEYVITTNGGHTAKQYEKLESLEYFNRHSRVLEIDYYYYLKQLANPLDQILDIIFTKDNNDNKYKYQEEFVLSQYKIRLQYTKLIKELKDLFGINIILEK